MHTINEDKAQMLKDSAQLRGLNAEMLSVVPGEELGGAAFPAQGTPCNTNTLSYFRFSPFIIKAKSFTDFF